MPRRTPSRAPPAVRATASSTARTVQAQIGRADRVERDEDDVRTIGRAGWRPGVGRQFRAEGLPQPPTGDHEHGSRTMDDVRAARLIRVGTGQRHARPLEGDPQSQNGCGRRRQARDEQQQVQRDHKAAERETRGNPAAPAKPPEHRRGARDCRGESQERQRRHPDHVLAHMTHRRGPLGRVMDDNLDGTAKDRQPQGHRDERTCALHEASERCCSVV